MKNLLKNLLTKTLFISLLLSAVIPSGVQAGFFTTNGKQFAKVAAVAVIVGAGIGKKIGIATPVVGSMIGLIMAERETVIGMQVEGRVIAEEAVESGIGAAAAVIGLGAATMGTGAKKITGPSEVMGTLATISVLAAAAAGSAAIGRIAGKSIGTLATVFALKAGAGERVGINVFALGVVLGTAAGPFLGTLAGAEMIKKITEKLLIFVEKVRQMQ